MTLFNKRVIALREAIKKAQNPEWKELWKRKLNELIDNEQKNRGEL